MSEIAAFFLDEIEVREKIVKKMKRFNTITGIVDAGGVISIVVFASGVGLLVGIALSGTTLLLSLATAITRKSLKIFTVKKEKHDAIKLLFRSKLDSITNIIPHAVQGEDTSPTEFHKVLQEAEKYLKLKADIRNQANAKVKEIMK